MPRSLAKIAFGVLLATSAHAQIAGASRLLSSDAAFTGIGRFNASLTCTAFLLDTSGPAYALSNGHCISTNSANEVIVDRAGGNLRIVFNYFQDTQNQQVPVGVKRIAYSTMKGLDIAVLELNATVSELRNQGITPLALSSRLPLEDEAVVTIGAPNTAIPPGETFLRRSECTLGPPADLIEFIWHFHSGYPNTCSDIKGGSSGTPVISTVSGEVVAIINTTTAGAFYETGDFFCFSGQPCEITPGAPFTYRPNTNYALPLAGVQDCFNVDGAFELARVGCPLDPGRQFTVTLRQRAVQPPATWSSTLTGSAWSHYRYKVVSEGFGDCRDAEGYGDPVAMEERNRIDDPLPETEGRYHLCVIGGEGNEWQDPRFATQVHLRVDVTPPTIPIPYQFRYQPDAYVVQPIFVVPELSGYRYRIDLTASTPCEQDSGYANFLRIPFRVPKDAVRVCLRGQDEANNEKLLELTLLGLQVFPDGVRNTASLESSNAVAPGQLITLQGVNLQGATLTMNGKPLDVFAAEEGQIDIRIASDAPVGRSELNISGPSGTAAVPVEVVVAAPGVFADSISVSEGQLTLRATGVPSQDVSIDAGGVTLTASVTDGPTPGVQRIAATLPTTFPLRGYVPVRVLSAGRRSQTVLVRFP